MKKNKHILKVEAMSSTGKGIGHIDDKVVFIDKAVPGDEVEIRIKKKKKKYIESVIQELITPSVSRTLPECSHFGLCGGCKWQHVRYGEQLKYKQEQVTDNLVKLGKTEIGAIGQILPSENPYNYRNKLEFTFSAKRWLYPEEIQSGKSIERSGLGFHLPFSFDKVVDISQCHLQASPSNEIRNRIRELAINSGLPFYDIVNHGGFYRNLIIRTTLSGETMMILQVGQENKAAIEHVLEAVSEEFPEISSLNYVVNTKKNDTFYDLQVHTYKGNPYITEVFSRPEGDGEISFRIGPKSFFQTNPAQAEKLYKIIWDMAALTGKEIVYDLYTGAGAIANYLAHGAKKIFGIDYVPEAIEDAKVNSSINNIRNTLFFSGDMKEVLSESFFNLNDKPDVMVCDPPRAGMHEDVCRQILKAGPEKIIYVSCNPATQARDIAILSEKYTVEQIQPVDMFPQTPHVENVAELRLRRV